MEEIRNTFMRKLNWFVFFMAITLFYFNRIIEGPITTWSHIGFATGYLILGGMIWVIEEVKVYFIISCFIACWCLIYAGLTWENDPTVSLPGLGIVTIIFFSISTIVSLNILLGDFIKDRQDHRRRTSP